jgi:hypothetical protein
MPPIDRPAARKNADLVSSSSDRCELDRMATLLKVLNNLADIKSAGGVALRVRTQGPPLFRLPCTCEARRRYSTTAFPRWVNLRRQRVWGSSLLRGQSSWNGRPISGIFGRFERPAGARIILIRLDNPPLLSRVKEALSATRGAS